MSYRALLHETRPVFLVLGFFARLPYAMTTLGTLVLLQSATGSYGFAGAAAGLQSLSGGAGGILVGRLTERFGLRRLGALFTVANAAALGALIAATHAGRPVMLGAAILVGLAQAQVSPLVRTHWSHLAERLSRHPHPGGAHPGRAHPGSAQFTSAHPSRAHTSLLTSAFSYEAAADEASFILGPAVTGLLAAVAVSLPAAAAATLLLLTALPLARFYTEPAPVRRTAGAAALPVLRLIPLVLAMGFMGAIFGVLQVGVTAYSARSGHPGAAGLLYAELGVGSALAGLACGWLPDRFGAQARYRTFAGGLLIGMTVIALGGVLLPMPVAVVLAGAAIAPYMISVYSLAERTSAGRVAVALTIVNAGSAVGTATGQTLAGTLVDGHGPHAAFILAPALAALALLTAVRPVRP
jgi:predicted MFS family arabinose efflux permease